VIYLPSANYEGHSIAAIERMLSSRYTVAGLGDGGAHCGLICDASLTTYALLRWSDARGGPSAGEGRGAIGHATARRRLGTIAG
jgi:N-acyl-D-aspartate/D-glutamate deacylase